MLDDAGLALRLIYSLTLLIAPGGFVAYSRLGRPLAADLRLAAAVVFAPLVLALELAMASLLGVSFGAFVAYIVPLNLLGFVPMLRLGGTVWPTRRVLPVLAIAALLVLPLIVPLAGVWYMREYGWHNMMQVAAIQQIYELPKMPEEADLAGLRLNYAWLGHAQVAIGSTILNWSPTILTPVINLVQLVAMVAFLVGATERLVGFGPWLASLATGVALLTPGMLDMIWTLATGADRLGGELRITPPTSKFLFMDTMVFGMSAFAMLVYVLTRCLAEPAVALLPFLSIAALACGLNYPLMFPSCVGVVGGFVLCAIGARYYPQFGLPRYRFGAIVSVAISFTVVTATVAAYILVLGASSATSPVQLVERWEIRKHLVQIFLIFGPIILGLLPFLPRLVRERTGAWLVPVALTWALLGGFLIFHLPTHAEYKFLFTAHFVAMPIIAAVFGLLSGGTRVGVIVLCAAFLALQVGDAWVIWTWHVPPSRIASSLPLDEASRDPRPRDGWQGSWMQAVSDATRPDTIVLTDDTVEPVSVFTDRSLFVVADWTDRGIPGAATARNGYMMNRALVLGEVKGYSKDEIARRVRILRDCLAPDTDDATLRQDLASIGHLGRPVAFHFAGPAALLDWLRQRGLGHAIFEAGTESVWIVAAKDLADLDGATTH